MTKRLPYIATALLLLSCLFGGRAQATGFYIGTSSTFSFDESTDTAQVKSMDEALKKQPLPQKAFEMQKSPAWAVLQSLIIPGLGQFYNEDYWKAPLFLGGAATLGYLMIDNHNQYIEYQKLYDNSEAGIGKDTANTYKEYYRDQRDMMGFYLLVVYILAAVDAYTGAHLYDFDVSDEKVTFSLSPNPFRGVSLNLRIRF